MQVSWKSASRMVSSTSRYLSLNHCGELRSARNMSRWGAVHSCAVFNRRCDTLADVKT